jgi:hypothetical protein
MVAENFPCYVALMLSEQPVIQYAYLAIVGGVNVVTFLLYDWFSCVLSDALRTRPGICHGDTCQELRISLHT